MDKIKRATAAGVNNENCSAASRSSRKIQDPSNSIAPVSSGVTHRYAFTRVDRSAPALDISTPISDVKMLFRFTAVNARTKMTLPMTLKIGRSLAVIDAARRHDTLRRDACRMERLLHSGSFATINGRRCTARRPARRESRLLSPSGLTRKS